MFAFNGTRRLFEPVVYTGLGWGHTNCSDVDSHSPKALSTTRDYMTYRAGAELNFNLGKERAWAVVVNPSVVWGNYPANGALCKSAGNFELTAGVVYHFKNSNGKRSFTKAHLYDANEVAALNAIISELKNSRVHQHEIVTEVVEKVVEKVVHDTVFVSPKVQFVRGTYRIAPTSMATIKDIASYIKTSDKTYDVLGFASVDGSEAYNQTLSENRAIAVKAALVTAGVDPEKLNAIGKGETEQFGSELEDNRVVIVESGK